MRSSKQKHTGSTSPTQNTPPKSAKPPPTKQFWHKSPILSTKNRQKQVNKFLPKSRDSLKTQTTNSHWPSWENVNEHQSEQ